MGHQGRVHPSDELGAVAVTCEASLTRYATGMSIWRWPSPVPKNLRTPDAYLRRRGIRPRIARRMIESSARLGRHRWTIERTGAWLGGFRRLWIRYERSSERFYALAMLACSVICFKALLQPRS